MQLSAVEILDPAAFPGVDGFTNAVRQARRTAGLPRRCRVVLWGLPDGANGKDTAVRSRLAPLTNAGFRVERVVTPCNALAALARLKKPRRDGPTCWLAINRGGVAIVAVRPGTLLYSHSFAWDSQLGASGSQARLLQRYSLVSSLAPQLKRAIAEARTSGAPVDALVICGNLPDLRSLTLPLVEELSVDVDIELLDSFDGVAVRPRVAEPLTESAPAIRLACGAAIARGTRPWDPSRRRSPSRPVGRYAAAAAVVLAIGGVAYQSYGKPGNAPPPARPAADPPAASPESTNLPPKSGSYLVASGAGLVAPTMVAMRPVANPPAAGRESANLPPKSGSDTVGTAGAPQAESTAPARPASNPPAASVPTKKPESSPPAPSNTVPVTRAPSPLTLPMPNLPPPGAPAARFPAAVRAPLALNTPPPSADKSDARVPLPPGTAAPRRPAPPLLDDAVPRVTAILVSSDRRFATVDGGRIVGIGDRLGRRTIVAMDEGSVVLREPSGRQIRVGLGGRRLDAER